MEEQGILDDIDNLKKIKKIIKLEERWKKTTGAE
jgi:hypothetical protein